MRSSIHKLILYSLDLLNKNVKQKPGSHPNYTGSPPQYNYKQAFPSKDYFVLLKTEQNS
jgi:hypothetical protein